MKFGVLALDYDGTIAAAGALDPDVRAAIAEVRSTGVVVVLVTGRILDDLRRVAGDLRFVDAVVAENGAVLAYPATGHSMVLGPPPAPRFVEELRHRQIEITIGACVVEASAEAAHSILALVREMELPLVLLFNRGRLMILPETVSKAAGLREALAGLRLSTHNAIGIGDAENDHRLLEVCEIGVAVGWGSRALKATADEVLEGPGPAAVADYIRRAAASPSLSPARVGRRRLLLGHDATGTPVELAVRGGNVLVAGDPRSGKSWAAGLICEQLIFYRYCICVVDPEGDFTGLEQLPGVVVLGGDDPPPRSRDLVRALRHPDMSVVIDLSRLGHVDKLEYMQSLLPTLSMLRRRTGLPHRIVVDEAHYFLGGGNVHELLDLQLGGYTLVTYQASNLHPDVLAANETTIVTLATDPREVEAFAAMSGRPDRCHEWGAVLGQLDLAEAAVLPHRRGDAGHLRRFRLVPRLSSHVRHREKYLDVPVPAGRAFVFCADGRPTGTRAGTLKEFLEIVASTHRGALDGHLRRSDFSRWIGDVFGDHYLASQIWRLEEQYRVGWAEDVNDRMVDAIRERYELPDTLSVHMSRR
ncbi:HAD hydrolase family protein [Luteitalea sp.]|uniref:HAD hydrolase family protein n=1 Tax=Luteitalea sp. TaxID=2004800 RepID=UPI0025C5B8ED|nr:HAD hydrolase family protein [Luteitalea sp.]